MEDSIFTKIIKGEIPCHKIYEDDKVIAFLDVHPLAEGHTLVVPKVQVDHIWDLDEETHAYLWSITRKIGSHIKQVLEPARVGVLVEGFGVPHVHVHLIPANHGNDLKQPQDISSEINHEALGAMSKKISLS